MIEHTQSSISDFDPLREYFEGEAKLHDEIATHVQNAIGQPVIWGQLGVAYAGTIREESPEARVAVAPRGGDRSPMVTVEARAVLHEKEGRFEELEETIALPIQTNSHWGYTTRYSLLFADGIDEDSYKIDDDASYCVIVVGDEGVARFRSAIDSAQDPAWVLQTGKSAKVALALLEQLAESEA